MSENYHQIYFPHKSMFDYTWDKDWANDWGKIVEIYDTIDHMEELFLSLHVSEARKLTQKQLILNLQKYALTLQSIIIHKYE